jgi:cell division protein FtsL
MAADAASIGPLRLGAARAPGGRARPSRAPSRARVLAGGAQIGRAARSRATRFNLLAGVIALLAALLHVWTGVTVGRLGYELSHARDLGQRLDRQLKELNVELNAARTAGDVAKEAQRRLGLDWPQPGQIVDLP